MSIELKADLISRLGKVSMGKEPADLIINNCDVLNVYTGEILENQHLLIAGDRIAYVGPKLNFPEGLNTKLIDADGQLIIPGMIDGHIHIDSLMNIEEFVELSLARGTTTIITECYFTSNAMGIKGVNAFIDQFKNLPQRLFATAPIISFLCSDNGDGISVINQSEMISLLQRPEILGTGEIYWSNLLNTDSNEGLINIIEAAISLGKTVEGHGAGAKSQRLAAVAAYGIDSCHEPITAEEVRERLRLGLFTMIREGSIRRELDAVIGPLIEMGLALRRAILVSDAVWPVDLHRYGHMNYIVQKAINLGLNPVTAIQMATINVAEHFHLGSHLGGIAPGKCADIVIIPNLKTIEPKLVICRGKVVARNGKMLERPTKTHFPADAYQCININPIQPGFFRVPATSPITKVRAIELITNIVNRETLLDLPVIDGEITIAGGDDVLKVAVINRYIRNGKGCTGFIKGYGLKRGALASSYSFDEGSLVVMGVNDSDMAAAVNRIRELQGGFVYCCEGQIVEELPLPILGCISDIPGTEVAAKFTSLERALKKGGCNVDNPLLTLLTITFTAIPSLRLLSRGYWQSRENRMVNVLA
ncbi:amidohydrolase family protein [Pelotomaculum terephthalicicum JT]|uniref:adenine deaminase n=1 Tax=Pelotomaculum terephthalicicum TaxID=206393 RepID=UPI001F03D0E4|nr:adenine deaminase C-terminal domain-containing protein [Pelotomaculum terephthalicicum]MCG9969944.1 amidohydrolase family protein [Pelotomaculum terephthalicicum JT]